MDKSKFKTMLLSLVMCSSCVLATAFSTVAWFEAKRQQEIAGDNHINVVSFDSKITLFEAYKFNYSLLSTEEEIELAKRMADGDEEAKKRLAEEEAIYDYDNPSTGKVIKIEEANVANAKMNIFDPAYLIINDNADLYSLNTNIVYKIVLETEIPEKVNVLISFVKKEMSREKDNLYISRYTDIQVFSQSEINNCIKSETETSTFYPDFYKDTENKTDYDPTYYAVSYLSKIYKDDDALGKKHLYDSTKKEDYNTEANEITIRHDNDSISNISGGSEFAYYININYSPDQLKEFAFRGQDGAIPVYYDCDIKIIIGEGS